MLKCEQIIEVIPRKDYRYCLNDGLFLVGDHWFCEEHAGVDTSPDEE